MVGRDVLQQEIPIRRRRFDDDDAARVEVLYGEERKISDETTDVDDHWIIPEMKALNVLPVQPHLG
jgi:hypothetical protein